jgi:peptidoglycan/xylan/chitin deacetylase (PgdA/CDA1 family)
MPNENVRIFLFHRISPVKDLPGRNTSPELFNQVLDYLDKKYSVIALEEYFFRERLKLPKQPVIITIDGSYRELTEYALPLLEKYDMPATIFISTECVDQEMPSWSDLIDFLFAKTSRLSAEKPPFKVEFSIKSKWENQRARLNYAKYLKKHIQSLSIKDRWQIIKFYISQFDDVALPEKFSMTWEELKAVKALGFEIGAHIIMDSFPATVFEESQLEFALRNSASTIREQLGNTPSAVSFSINRNNSKIKNLIHRTGYKLGLAVGQKIYIHGKYGRYTLPRIEIYNESFLKTRLRINGTFSRLRRLVWQ